MGDNAKYNEKCIKGNVMYYKIKIDQMIEYEINKLKVDENLYKKLNITITDRLSKFSDKLIEGGDFNENMTKLRDDLIADCVEISDNSPEKMRPYFRDYIFDKIYTMGINIKKGLLPEDYEQELEEARLKAEEEEKLKQEEEKLNQEKEINIKIEDETEEKQPDLIDQMWNYFFPNSKSAGTNKNKEKVEKESKKKEEKSEEIDENSKIKFN